MKKHTKDENTKGTHFDKFDDETNIVTSNNKSTTNEEVNQYVENIQNRASKTKRKKLIIASSDNEGSDNSSQYPLVTKTNSRRHRHHKPKMKLYKKILIAVGSVVLAVCLIAAVTAFTFIYSGSKEVIASDNDINVTAPSNADAELKDSGKYVTYKGKKYEYNKNITNILCLGIDKTNISDTSNIYGANGQSDAIILVALDTSNGKMTLINISRELMTDIMVYSSEGHFVETKKEQLCLAYAYGDGKDSSCQNTLIAVQRVFYNIPIASYLSLDLDGIASINDAVGGVTVKSPETIGDFVKGETYHLEGEMATQFVRKRDTSYLTSNTARMKRQQVYLKSFMNKVISQTKKDISTPIALFNAASDFTCTNLNTSRISYFAQILISKDYKYDMESVPGTIKAGEKNAEFYVDDSKFYDMFINIFYKPVK